MNKMRGKYMKIYEVRGREDDKIYKNVTENREEETTRDKMSEMTRKEE